MSIKDELSNTLLKPTNGVLYVIIEPDRSISRSFAREYS